MAVRARRLVSNTALALGRPGAQARSARYAIGPLADFVDAAAALSCAQEGAGGPSRVEAERLAHAYRAS